jgi:hypothetical protein
MRKPKGAEHPVVRKKPPKQPSVARRVGPEGRPAIPVCVLSGSYEYHYSGVREALKEWVLQGLPYTVNADGERVYTSDE